MQIATSVKRSQRIAHNFQWCSNTDKIRTLEIERCATRETGNDDFGARYYTNRFGHWLSADWSAVPVAVPYANLTNPQTLNLYSMVADDPESFSDLDGHNLASWNKSPTYLEQHEEQAENAYYDQVAAENAVAQQAAQNTSQQQEPVVVADGYTVDKFSHGGPHIDRVDDGGKLVGRYDENGNPIEFKGKTPPSIPRRDKKKFQSAADKLKEYKERVRKANENQQSAPAPGKAPAKFQGFPIPNCAGPCDGSPYFLPLPAGPLPGLSVPSFGPVEIPVFVPA